jgi:hypothetical protein
MNLRARLTTMMLLGAMSPLLASSCGGGGSAKPATVTDFCDAYAAAVCQVSNACGGDPSVDTCKAAQKMNCAAMAMNATASGMRVFTPANMSACTSLTNNLYSQNTPITPTQMDAATDKCNYVFQGTVMKGASCTTKYDCAGTPGTVICDKGVCATQTLKNLGDGCSDAGAVCNTGSYCKMGTNGFYTCVAKVGATMACDATTPCLESLRCSSLGKCTDRVGMGMMCASNSDCASTAPFCDPFANGGTCDAGLRFAPGSASCAQFGMSTGAAGMSGGAAGMTGGTAGAAGGTAGSDGGAAGAGGGAAGSDGATD